MLTVGASQEVNIHCFKLPSALKSTCSKMTSTVRGSHCSADKVNVMEAVRTFSAHSRLPVLKISIFPYKVFFIFGFAPKVTIAPKVDLFKRLLLETALHNNCFVCTKMILDTFQVLPTKVSKVFMFPKGERSWDKMAILPFKSRKKGKVKPEIILKFDRTFKDYPKILFTKKGIDLAVYIGSGAREKESVPRLKFDPANIADAQHLIGLGAFLGFEWHKSGGRNLEELPDTLLDLNIEFKRPLQKTITPKFIVERKITTRNLIGKNVNCNLLLIGSGNVNPMTALVLKTYEGQLPINFDESISKAEIYSNITDTHYRRETSEGRVAGLLLMVPNPWNKQKVAIVAAGTTRWGTEAAIRALSHPNLPNNKQSPDIPAKVVKAITDIIGQYEFTIGHDFYE